MQLALSGPVTQHFQFRDPLALRGAWRSSYCSLASLKGILRPPATFWNPLELGRSLGSCLTCSESCFGGSYPGILLPPPLLPSQEQKEMVRLSLEDWKLCADWTSPFPEAGWARKQAAEWGRGGGGEPSRISASSLHGFFSLKLHLNPVRAGWAAGWRPRQLAGSLGPPRALREMRW